MKKVLALSLFVILTLTSCFDVIGEYDYAYTEPAYPVQINFVTYRCGYCGGTGYVRFITRNHRVAHRTCPRCIGRGYVVRSAR